MKIQQLKQPGFEQVIRGEDPDSGLVAFIAIHSTRLGPSLGGIRMFPYRNENEALYDVMRLAEAMTFKAAASKIHLGGGKAVIIGDPEKDKTEKLLRSMGQLIKSAKGVYFAAKDAGIAVEDLVTIAQETEYVAGLPEIMGGSGDPSPWTAIGILSGMKACAEFVWGSESLKDKRVAIQGLGHVGMSLAQLLYRDRASLAVTDVKPIDPKTLKDLHAKLLTIDEALFYPSDILAPCAMGSVIRCENIARLNCRILAGAANNQLADEAENGLALHQRNILYAPDYIINAGGLIHIYVRDILKEKDSLPYILAIRERLKEVFELSKKDDLPPAHIAKRITQAILENGL